MRPNSNSRFGLKKGAWTADEDMLLQKCIEKYREGKWHLIPLKAGLNKCRKSCRLRWLNYLRPNIKRGDFGEDEVDLIIRLHKLLGNRWSLIAGRIPGRTANDVKNYWNTHILSRFKQQKKEANENKSLHDTTVTINKPQPRTFSKALNCYMRDNPQTVSNDSCKLIQSSDDGDMINNINMSSELLMSPNLMDDKMNEYLEELFDDHEMEIGGKVGWPLLSVVDNNSLSDFPMDEAIWNVIDSDQL